MSLASVGIVLCTATAAFVAWRLGGTVGQGIIGGALLGGAVAGFGLAWMRHVQRVNPAKLMNASLAVSLVKLSGLCVSWLVLRFVAAAGAWADWKSFLVAYAGVALIATLLGAIETLHTMKTRQNPTTGLDGSQREASGRSEVAAR